MYVPALCEISHFAKHMDTRDISRANPDYNCIDSKFSEQYTQRQDADSRVPIAVVDDILRRISESIEAR